MIPYILFIVLISFTAGSWYGKITERKRIMALNKSQVMYYERMSGAIKR